MGTQLNKFLAKKAKMLILTDLCPGGGIGRRRGFKIPRLRV